MCPPPAQPCILAHVFPSPQGEAGRTLTKADVPPHAMHATQHAPQSSAAAQYRPVVRGAAPGALLAQRG